MILFSKPNCEKCDDIKLLLKKNSLAYIEKSIKDEGVMAELQPLLAGKTNPLLPVLQFDDGSVVTNDMGIFKELRAKGLLAVK